MGQESPVIRPLRRAHLRVILLLAILLPILLALALVSREALPLQHDWPFDQQ